MSIKNRRVEFLPESQDYSMLLMLLAIQSCGYVIPKVSRLSSEMMSWCQRTELWLVNLPSPTNVPPSEKRPYDQGL